MFFKDVGEFHAKFALPNVNEQDDSPHLLTPDEALYRIAFMAEELVEFMTAHNTDDLAQAADALVDIVYVALGTAHLMHVPFEDVWDAVHAANMLKERGPTAKRGHSLDVRKPPGWQSPDILAALGLKP